ncbi:MAG TPA: SigE family RNA polymerase sigma factor, partial [Nocardioides sp.]|nr:SigE family RNA polymerase sigma factor [Nocardioides sp.]
MTDLERLWDDFPTGPAPTEAILRAARRAELRQEAAQDATADAIHRALAGLTKQARDVVVLRYFVELSEAQTA